MFLNITRKVLIKGISLFTFFFLFKLFYICINFFLVWTINNLEVTLNSFQETLGDGKWNKILNYERVLQAPWSTHFWTKVVKLRKFIFIEWNSCFFQEEVLTRKWDNAGRSLHMVLFVTDNIWSRLWKYDSHKIRSCWYW